MFDSNVNRTEKTNEWYRYRGRLIFESAARSLGISIENLNPFDFLDIFELLLMTLQDSSRRVYLASSKAWLIHMRTNNIAHGGLPNELDEAIEEISEMKSEHYNSDEDSNSKVKRSKEPGLTSSTKEKSVNPDELFNLEELLLWLIQNESYVPRKWMYDVFIFIHANILVGLRPCEWRRAYLDILEVEVDKKVSKCLCLVIYNAKHTNGRGHGEKRHLVLTDMPEHHLDMLKKQLVTIKDYRLDDNSWAKYYNGISAELRKLTRTHLDRPGEFPTFSTLYSTRHQFGANAKFAGFKGDEIAAMMGHATDLTVFLHYAKKHMGTSGFCVKPIGSEVAKIRNVRVEWKNKNFRGLTRRMK